MLDAIGCLVYYLVEFINQCRDLHSANFSIDRDANRSSLEYKCVWSTNFGTDPTMKRDPLIVVPLWTYQVQDNDFTLVQYARQDKCFFIPKKMLVFGEMNVGSIF